MRYAQHLVADQLAAIFRAWGMPEEQIAPTVRVMVEADMRGIDSHGVTMMPLYAEHRAAGKLVMSPEIRILRDQPVTALIDGGGGMGHAPSVMAMELAIRKARAAGIAAVGVRNSNHYGAAGIYALMAADAGLIGFSSSAVYKPAVVPTFATLPMFGTNPIAFAAPAARNPPFVLDMATSTTAIGKLKLALMQGKSLPVGWALDDQGQPVTDPEVALRHRLMTPLGGSRELGGHKGYGLAAMVEVLSTMLTGGSYAPTRPADAERFNVGHFFLAIDPAAFRDAAAFEADMDGMIDALHAAPPVDPAEPVLVHGDPEAAVAADRRANGIPLHPEQVAALRKLAADCGAPFLLAET